MWSDTRYTPKHSNFAYMRTCLCVGKGDKKECWVPWSWGYRKCEPPGMGVGPELCPMQEHWVLSTTNLSFQPYSGFVFPVLL